MKKNHVRAFPFPSPPRFKRSSSLPSKWMASCCTVRAHFGSGIVHLAVMFCEARNTIFIRARSLGNTDFDLVTLRTWRLKPYTVLVV